MRGLGSLRRGWERLGILPQAIILAYHRVADLDADPQMLTVSPQHFTEQLAVLRHDYHPLRLCELRRGMCRQRWQRRTVVLTFDDGYADNLHQAKPQLEAADIPATVFVTAGKVDGAHEFWWDELESIFLTGAPLPTELEMSIANRSYHKLLPANQEETAGIKTWHVLMDQTTSTPRQTLYLELAGALQGLDHNEREAVMDRLFHWAGQAPRQSRPTHRALNSSEVRDLANGGLVEVGSHTMTHPVLSMLPMDVQRHEITMSKRILEATLGREVTSFAYPFGGRAHYTPQTARFVKASGFSCACSNFQGQVAFYSDPYQLPRYLVRDWDGVDFAKHLEDWFGLR